MNHQQGGWNWANSEYLDQDQEGEGFDLHKMIGKLPRPKKGFVLPGHRYTGPFNPLSEQLEYNPTSGEITRYFQDPTGKTDAIASQHDVDYTLCSKTKNPRKCKNEADRRMVKALDAVPKKQQQWGHFAARNLINLKQKLGLGINQGQKKKKKIPLETKYRVELNKDVRRHFPRRQVLVGEIDQIWACDLADMSDFGIKDNNGYKFLLMVIDVFSKYGWAIPIKNKKATTIVEAIKGIEKSSGRSPKNLWSDTGAEFENSLVKKNWNWYTTYSDVKTSVVERWIRTIKNMLNKRLKGRKWIDVIQKVVDSYNKKVHSTTGMSPKQASLKRNEEEIRTNSFKTPTVSKKVTLKKGDIVRIPQTKWRFTKGYKNKWTKEVFKIKKVNQTHPVTFFLVDGSGQNILGSFYREELQKSQQPLGNPKTTKPRKRQTAQKGLDLVLEERKRKTARDRKARAKKLSEVKKKT